MIINIKNLTKALSFTRANKKSRRFCVRTFVVFLIMMSVLSNQINIAQAAFNKQINYQGKLTNTSNVAVSDGVYHMTFRLYTTATSATTTNIWEEDRSTSAGNRVTITNGLFSVMLGSSTALTSVNFDQTLYLGVEVGGSSGSPSWDGEMTPRKILGAVPAAFVADTVDNLSSEQFLRSDVVNATSTSGTFFTATQNGAGKIAEFFGPSSVSILSIASTGNIGIGTTTPYAKLSVVGQVVASYFTATTSTASTFPYASTTALTVSGTGGLQLATGLNGPLQANAGLVSATSSIGALYGGTGLTTIAQGDILFGSASNAFSALTKSTTANSFLKNSGSSNNPAWSTIASGDLSDTANIALLSGSQTFTGTKTFSNSTFSALFTGGNVGIGTTTPWGFLSINPNAIGTGPAFVIGSSTKTDLIVTNGGNVGIGSTTPWGRLSVNTNNLGSNPSFVISSSTMTNFIVTNSGRVGIGTSSPLGTFTVEGYRAGFFNSGPAESIYLAGGSGVLMGVGIEGSVGGNVIITGGEGGQDQFETDLSGGAVSIAGGAGSGAAPGGNVNIDPGDNKPTAASPLGYILLASQTFGQVGIGTTTPWGLLSVNANTRLSGAPQFVVGSSTATNFIVANGGNVGIGTTSPYAKLSVVGQVVASYFTATTSTASTFPYASTTALTVSGTGGLQLATGLNGPLQANAGLVSATSSVGAVYGGTGLTTIAQGDILFGSASNAFSALTKTGTANSFLKNSGTSNNPAWSTIASGDLSDTANIALLNGSQTFTGTPTFSNASTYSALFTGGNVGIGTTTPWGLLSVNANALAAGVPQFVVGSSTATNFIVANGGNVGIGTTTPWAYLSVVGNSYPQLVIATTTGATPLMYVTSTTTGNLDWVRIGIGTTTNSGTAGLRDQFVVAGRIYSTWKELRCDMFGSDRTLTANRPTGAFCGQFAMDTSSTLDGGYLFTANANPSYGTIRAGITTTAIVGEAFAIRTGPLSIASTDNPVMETSVRTPTIVAGTGSTSAYYIGFTNHPIPTSLANSYNIDPTSGVYFAASSTNTWRAVARTAGVETSFDTGIATSTTAFTKMRIELTPTLATFLINNAVVGTITTNIPTGINMSMVMSVAVTQTVAFTPRDLEISFIRLWVDDPPGGQVVQSPSTLTSLDTTSQPYDAITGGNISTAYLVGEPSDYAEGEIVSIDDSSSMKVKKSDKKYDGLTIGVVGGNPLGSAQILGNENEKTIRVAMHGRANVLVNNENGKIKVGDLVTTSSSAGIGMKALGSGYVIGRALSALASSELQGTIIVELNPQYYSGNIISTDDKGNVGIGTSTPSSKLDVIGNVQAFGFTTKAKRSLMENIVSLGEENYNSYLDKIRNINISTYQYKDDGSGESRLGIISDNAPSEILSVSGDNVDIYKLATLTLGGVKSLQNKFDALDVRVTALENIAFGLATTTATTTTSATSAGFMDSILSHLGSLGANISQGFAGFKKLMTETLTVGSRENPTGITIFDDKTGEPHCLSISNGNTKTTAGECGAVQTNGGGSDDGGAGGGGVDGGGAGDSSGKTTSDTDIPLINTATEQVSPDVVGVSETAVDVVPPESSVPSDSEGTN